MKRHLNGPGRTLIVATPGGLDGNWFERYYERHLGAGFKRLHRQPRAALKGATLESLTPRGAWLLKRSQERYLQRDDAYGLLAVPTGVMGRVESIRFITSNLAPSSVNY